MRAPFVAMRSSQRCLRYPEVEADEQSYAAPGHTVRNKRSLCCKRHDRVFGLFGLVLNGLDFLSEPNYEADLGDLSISMTRSYIERRSIDIILLAHYRGERSTLPSWSPDWFRFDEYTLDRHIHDQLVQRRNQDFSSACPKGWYTTGNACATFSVSNCTLKISARYLGTICSLGRSVRP
jgi:hypothetical protein